MVKRGALILSGFILILIFSFFVCAANSENSTEWWMYGKNLNHTAWDGVSFPTISGLNNAIFSSPSSLYSSVSVYNGSVFLTSAYGTILTELNASNISQQIRNFTTDFYSGSHPGVSSSPAIANGYLYFGTNDPNGFIYQFNVSNISQQIASYTTGGYISASPIIANGNLYIIGGSGATYNLFQLNSTNISKLIANSSMTSIVSSTAAFANGFVYASNGSDFLQFNASNVSIKIASIPLPFSGGQYPGPAVYNGSVYVGAQTFLQLNASNVSQVIANFTNIGSGLYSNPAIANGYVYTSNDLVYQLNASNVSQQIANFSTDTGTISTTPLVANGYVYIGGGVGANDYNIYQLNASNVSQLIAVWNSMYSVSGPPAYANGYIYFASQEGTLYQLNASNISQLNEAGTIHCNSCGTCSNYINNAPSGSVVQLTASISPPVPYNDIGFGCIQTHGNRSVTFDCNGNSINYSDVGYDYGISIGSNNTIIENCAINGGFTNGILFDTPYEAYINKIILRNINVSYANGAGIYLGKTYQAADNVLQNIIVANSSGPGILIGYSDNNTITNITVYNNTNGFENDYGSNNTVTNFIAYSNDYGINLGVYNGANNNQLINAIISDNTLSGVLISNGVNDTLINVTSNSNRGNSDGFGGIVIQSSSNYLINVTANSNLANGIAFTNGGGNTLTNAIVNNNTLSGLSFQTSSDNVIINITATENMGSGGVYFYSSRSSSTNNTLTNSRIENNTYGLYFSGSKSYYNLIYNNLINNTINTYNETDGLANDFNTTLALGTNIVGGPYLGGNYWANLTGSGFSDACTDADENGICDSSYSPDGLNQDYFPLAQISIVSPNNPPPETPSGNFGVSGTTIVNITAKDKSVTSSATFTNITAGVPITFYPNSTAIGVSSITLTTNKTVYNATINISASARTSRAELKISEKGETYRSFTISTLNLNDTVIKKVIITFPVNISWFTANHLDPLTLKLYRNINTTQNHPVWTALQTVLVSSDSQYYSFVSTSPGFSDYTVFAGGIECNEGSLRCLLSDSQVCSGNVWILSQHCEFECNEGRCITASKEGANFLQNILSKIQGLISNLSGTLKIDTGTLTYYSLIIVILLGILIASIILIRNVRRKIRNTI